MLYSSMCHVNGKLCIRVIMKVRASGSTQVMPCYDNDYLCSNDFTSSLRAVKTQLCMAIRHVRIRLSLSPGWLSITEAVESARGTDYLQKRLFLVSY